MVIYLGLALVIAALACAFALQNSDPVTVVFLAWKIEASLALVLIFTLAIGAGIALLAVIPSFIRDRWTTPLEDEDGDKKKPEAKGPAPNETGGNDEPSERKSGDQDREAGSGPS